MDILIGMKEYFIYVGAFVLAFLLASIATPVVKKIAFKIGAVAYPNERTMHKEPMAVGGGLAIFFGFIVTVLIFIPSIGFEQMTQFSGLIIGATLITAVGLLDDIYNLTPKIRIVFQVLAALIAIYTGTSITSISVPFIEAQQIEFGYMSNIITLFWIVGLTNAVNFLDGLDGLAAGIASIASLVLMAIAILFGDPLVAGFAIVLTASLAGACLGFLPQNFNPAKIFMGDTGSTFLGYALAVISIQSMLKTYTALTLIVAVIVLALPIFDTVFAIFRRAINKKPIHMADRGHLHHRLVDRGLSHKKAVITLYIISGSFGIAAILIVMQDVKLAVLIIAFIFVVWLGDLCISYFKKNKLSE